MSREDRRAKKSAIGSLSKLYGFTKYDVGSILAVCPDPTIQEMYRTLSTTYGVATETLSKEAAQTCALIDVLCSELADKYPECDAMPSAIQLAYCAGKSDTSYSRAERWAFKVVEREMPFEEYREKTQLIKLWSRPWSEIRELLNAAYSVEWPELTIKRPSKEIIDQVLRYHYMTASSQDLKAEFTSMTLDYTVALPYLIAEVSRIHKQQEEKPPTKRQADHIAYLKRSLEKVMVDRDEKVRAAKEGRQEEINSLTREINLLKKQLEARTNERDEALSRVRDLQAEIDAEAEAETVPEDELLQLPSEGVVIVGGHNNMFTALRKLYPGWRYIQARQAENSDLGNPEMVFVYTNYCSHPAEWHAVKSVGRDRVRKIGGDRVTNIPQLVRYMRYLYTKSKEEKQ